MMKRKTATKFLSAAMSVVLALGLTPLPAFAETSAEGGTGEADSTQQLTAGVAEWDADTDQAPVDLEIQAGSNSYYKDLDGSTYLVWDYAEVGASINSLDGSQHEYYVVNHNVTWKSRLTAKGTVNLILADGATLTLNKGLALESGAKLTIWQQNEGTGTLAAKTSSDHKAAIAVNEGSTLTINGGAITAETYTDDAAGIGGDKGKSAGAITINAGTITARSDMNAAAIGGGKSGGGGTITINGGTVTATAHDEDGAGIGGGEDGSGGAITINGGTVTATGTDHSAGIGGNDVSGTIVINGGSVTATGGTHGAGIGGGNGCKGESITINGGTVTAKGGAYAAGIGAGGDSGADTIAITGGTVTAWGGTESAGIGSANRGRVETIEITGGHVNGIGSSKAAGIGGGDGAESNGTYGTITISGEGTYVGAIGGNEAAGLGTGNEAETNNGTITIKDGAEVYAVAGTYRALTLDSDGIIKRADTSIHYDQTEHIPAWLDLKNYGAGIGGGDRTPSGTINIENAKVAAYGANGGAGIGSGCEAGSTGDITITNSNVEAWGGGMNATYDNFNHDKGSGGAGIGGGTKCGGNASGNITISGGTINARAGSYAAGIGGGDEGGFGSIIIKDGANVTSRGGKHGAAIGSGDVSSNGNKEAWKTGSIEIYGADTKITAYGGDEGGAGIGGGDDGYGCNITIAGVGYNGNGTRGAGFIHSEGNMRGAGIGGGPGKAFGNISITGSLVMSFGGYGAGIGGGGGKLGSNNPSHVNGGNITITNSQVSSASLLGGAGVGGGIFGRADSITISGGMVDAHGGQMGGPGTLSDAFLANYICSEFIYKGGLGLANEAFSISYGTATSGTGGAFAVIAILGKGVAELVDFLSNTNPDVVLYIGAGIGGGYKEGSGNITIKDNAVITAVSGVLPPSIDKNGYSGHAIGNGKGYTGANATVTVESYNPLALVLTKRVKLSDDFQPTLYDETGPAPYATPGVADLVTDRQVVAILPMPVQQNATVTFDANASDATGTMEAQTISAGESAGLDRNCFTREGYVFDSWNTAADGTGTTYADRQEITLTGNLTLYAQWAPAVTIKYMSNQESECMRSIVRYGSTIRLSGPTVLGGKKILGWTEDPSGTGDYCQHGYQIENVTRNYTWYAVYEEESVDVKPSVEVTYYPNGGNGNMFIDYAEARSTEDLTSEYAVKGDDTFSRTGYTLAGWNTSENGDGTSYSFGDMPFELDNIDPEAPLSLYAQWQPKTYTVKFDANGGEGAMADQVFTYNDSELERLSPNAFTKDGFEFSHWCTVPDPQEGDDYEWYYEGEPINDLEVKDGTDTITLYAQWATPSEPDFDIYLVMFDENAPEDREEGQNEPGVSIQLLYPDDPEPMKLLSLEDVKEDAQGGYVFPHYTFAGWNTKADGSGAAYGDESAITPEDEIDGATLYAQWQPNEYTVTFVDEDGTVLQSSQVAYGEMPEFLGDEPTKATSDQHKYKFAGWDKDIVPVAGEATYTATYSEELQEYTIKFVDEDGTELQSIDVASGEMPEFEGETPTKQGDAQYAYEFAGWTPELAEVTGEATYTATYTTRTYLSNASVTVAKATYNGKALTPAVTVVLNGKTLKAGSDYTVSYANNKNAGTGTVTVTGTGSYIGKATKAFSIAKAANTLRLRGKTAKVKAAKVKKAAQYLKAYKVVKVLKNTSKGKLTYKKTKGNKKIVVGKTGKVTVKKGLKKGTYKVKVKVTSKATKNYKAKSVTFTFKVKVA